MKELLDDEEHMDMTFLVHATPPGGAATPTKRKVKTEPGADDDHGSGDIVEIRAHKCLLTARADYFKALFRKSAGQNAAGKRAGTFRESTECVVRVEPIFAPKIVRLMLEFLYTNRIECLGASERLGGPSPRSAGTDELLSLLHLADMWQLRDLKRLVEHEASKHRCLHSSFLSLPTRWQCTDS